ncbi:MAG: asparagine synthase (glutamine-hydrolyzing) [Blastocatellia bacterium AA13]|nr:MAG: asparagine synthase (glutamine-hydrolyzing) [Blastocatellia bacterium AA13]
MCGICGVAIPRTVNRTVDQTRLEQMSNSLTHRGPDDSGLYIASRVGLAHRRLSIVDLDGGRQPMPNEDKKIWITFNGEIYNHRDLRPELEEHGHVYRTFSDTETIIHLYEESGLAAVEKLRGMFAFGIWDSERQRLVLARDRLGIKPLYYAITDNGSIYFASEIKALIESGAIKPCLNYDVLSDYAANRAPSGEETLFKGVKRLAPGHTLVWTEGHVQINRYWDASFAKDSEFSDESEYVERFDALFHESVKLRLMADVPLGVFLSGGIDSSAIAVAMSGMVQDRIKTFSVAFAEREGNELEYARAVARQIKADHHEVVITPDQFFDALPDLVYQEDEPMAHPSSIPLYFVSKLAARHVKVVLSGEGSDELLAGYGKYGKTIYNVALARAYRLVTPAAARRLVKNAVESNVLPLSIRQKLERTFLCLGPDVRDIYLDNFSVFSRSRQEKLFTSQARERMQCSEPYGPALGVMMESDAATLLDQLLAVDLKTYLTELLMKQDQMSMAASLESRVPFLDHKLVEFAAGLPTNMKLRGLTTKYILRRAMKGKLPPSILTRSKMGFPVPLGRWLRGSFGALLDEYVLGKRALDRGIFEPGYVKEIAARHRAGEDHTERLWSLMNFEIWQRRFIDGENISKINPQREAVSARAAVSSAGRSQSRLAFDLRKG